MSTTSPISFGTIGTSWITASFITAAHSTSKWRLRAIYSRHADTAKHFAAKHASDENPIEKIKIHTSLEDLANDEDVKVVYIASPNSLHYANAKAMLEKGKHVVLEKPAARNTKELDSLFTIARDHNVFLLEGFRHLHEANFKTFKQVVRSGRLGKIYAASLGYSQFSSRYEKVLNGEVPNIFSLEFAGGSLVDLGVYCVAAALDLFFDGEIDEHSISYDPILIDTGVDGAGFLSFNLKEKSGNVIRIRATASKIFNSSAPTEVYGENGTVSIPSVTDIDTVTFWDSKTKEKEELGGERHHLNLNEMADQFARVIAEKDTTFVKGWEELSRRVVNVTENARWGLKDPIVFKGEEDVAGEWNRKRQ